MKIKTYKTKIKDLEIEYQVEYRKVKYNRWQIKQGQVKLILSKGSKVDVEEYFHTKSEWIYRKLVKHRENVKSYDEKTRDLKLENRTLTELKSLVNVYIEKYEKQLNVKVNRLQYRDMTRKWGSCSSLKNVTLATNLKFISEKLVAYIVYHELTHLIVLAHNDEFYRIIKMEFPDYKNCDKELSNYSYMILKNSEVLM